MRHDAIKICISAQRSVNMMVSSGGGRVTDDLFQRVLSDSLKEFVRQLKEEQKRCLRSLV